MSIHAKYFTKDITSFPSAPATPKRMVAIVFAKHVSHSCLMRIDVKNANVDHNALNMRAVSQRHQGAQGIDPDAGYSATVAYIWKNIAVGDAAIASACEHVSTLKLSVLFDEISIINKCYNRNIQDISQLPSRKMLPHTPAGYCAKHARAKRFTVNFRCFIERLILSPLTEICHHLQRAFDPNANIDRSRDLHLSGINPRPKSVQVEYYAPAPREKISNTLKLQPLRPVSQSRQIRLNNLMPIFWRAISGMSLKIWVPL